MSLKLRDSGLRWYWVVALVLLLDQASKLWVMANFEYRETLNLLPFFNLTYARNTGAAFSFLAEAGGWQRWLFALVALGFSLLLTLWLRRQPASMWRSNLAYTLVIGGAIGNLIDRLQHGFVVDFLDFFWGTSHYPAFNIADSAIFIGAALIIIDSFRESKSADNGSKAAKE
ncbi:signal peptidase II [Shewanella cyperi]|uniref:Lipoprotein signal peptidase n=1 Tax=Shewanella cyperi TaxID=2814292 RepID=A0A974XPH0_9GAMM|nr:signal peptidase II [Shewanella cyperi]QSX30866.1 signal peptidase II [Shewanella cyperi]QSX41644.1 signal peptidase II [Shewanella cyperi]